MKALSPTIWPRKRKRVARAGVVFTAAAALHTLTALAQDRPAGFTPPPLTVPDGFEVSLAASPPLVSYPMMACLDDRGRLYIAESDGRNLTTREEIEKELPRFVRRLVDTDGDGVFDQSTIFADKMTMPEGGLWHNGALYIISPPYLWRLEDTDDDGIADKREKILGSMNFDGRANQHGPYLGPNGRFYFTGGHFGYQFTGTDGSKTGTSRAAGVFSCNPDGSEVRIEGQGGINPVDVVFTKSGEMLSTCAIFDSFGGRRHDALIHWIPGGLTQRVYGLPLLPETGYRLPAVSRWGQVAPAGLVRYRGGNFGRAYKDTLFVCQFNTNKVVHVRLVENGATFTTEEEDFLTSPNIDFHPADILEDADGSLLLVDTGGWLSWGCPHSKIAKPEVRGAVYRIRRKGGENIPDARGIGIPWKTINGTALAGLLGDARPAVRDRARATLIARGAPAADSVIELYRRSKDPEVRQRCLWTLSQIKSEPANAALHRGMEDEDAMVRQVAARSLGILKDASALRSLIELLVDENPAVRRTAATALGRIDGQGPVAALFDALQPDSELYFQHAVTLALIEIGNEIATAAYLAESTPPHRKVTALRVLDQLDSGVLAPSMLVPFLNSPHPALRDEARRVIAGRLDWRDEILKVFTDLLDDDNLDDAGSQLLEGIVLTFAEDKAFHEAIARSLGEAATPAATKVRLLTSIGFMKELPDTLHPAIGSALASSSELVQPEAIAVLVRFAASARHLEELKALATKENGAMALRVAALEAIAQDRKQLNKESFGLLTALLRDPATDSLLSRQAARAIGQIELAPANRAQAFTLCELIRDASPLEISALLPPFQALSRTGQAWPAAELDSLGVELATAMMKSPGRDSLQPDQVETTARTFPANLPKTHAAFLQLRKAAVESAAVRQGKLEEMLEEMTDANASRGRALFHSNRATCSLCHRVNERGGSLGPNLSTIGGIRSRKDLLEAIIFPSATVVNGFESYLVSDHDGGIHGGLVQRETTAAVYLRNADQRLQRVPRESIRSMIRSPISVMPKGFEQLFTTRQLGDLVAFLETCR